MKFLSGVAVSIFLFLGSMSHAGETLISATPVARNTVKALELSRIILKYSEAIRPKYDVKFFQILYYTKNVKGDRVQASGLIVVPDVQMSLPIMSLQHGTIMKKNQVPSEIYLSADASLAALLSSMGFAVICSDYLGLGMSEGLHPYLHAETEASASADLLIALQEWAAQEKLSLRNEVYLLGYSQGGHATLALHRYLENQSPQKIHVKASAPMAGPYALSTMAKGDTVYTLDIPHVLYLMYSMDHSYSLGRLHHYLTEPYDEKIQEMFDGKHSYSDIAQMLNGKKLSDIMSPSKFVEFKNNLMFSTLLKENDVYDWKPRAPVRFYHGKADRTVPYENAETAYNRMKELGADVQLINLGDSIDHVTGIIPAFSMAMEWFLGLSKTQ
jgi:predicted esterase